MKTKTIMRILTVVMVIAMIATLTSTAFAEISLPEGNNMGAVPTGLQGSVSIIISIVQFICYAAAVIMLIVLGVKFISASPDGKAEIKKSAVIYVVGAILVFFAGVILEWVKNANLA